MSSIINTILSAKPPLSFRGMVALMKEGTIHFFDAPEEILLLLSQSTPDEAFPNWRYEEAAPGQGEDMLLYKAEADYLLSAYKEYFDSQFRPVVKPLPYDEAKSALLYRYKQNGLNEMESAEHIALVESTIKKYAPEQKSETTRKR